MSLIPGVQERRLIGHWLTRVIKTEQSTVEASATLDGVTLTDSLIRWLPNEWPSVCREIPVSADKMFWTSNKRAQWTLYSGLKSKQSKKPVKAGGKFLQFFLLAYSYTFLLYIAPKRRIVSKLCSVTSQNTAIFIVTVVITFKCNI
jgi:hypothetical protein